MKYEFEIRIDDTYHNVGLWDRLWEGYKKNALGSYILHGFKKGQYLFRRIADIFHRYQEYLLQNSVFWKFDPQIAKDLRWRFDYSRKAVVFCCRQPALRTAMQRLEYGVPGQQAARHVFSQLNQKFYDSLRAEGLME